MRERGEAARGNFPPPEKKLVEDRKALKPKLQARAQVRRTAATHRIKASRYVRPTNIIVPAPFFSLRQRNRQRKERSCMGKN